MHVLGTHRVSFDSIRRLAIECHALDRVALPLLTDATHEDMTGRTKEVYEELFTSRLLALAIAIRTKFYQGMDAKRTSKFAEHCGLLYRTSGRVADGPIPLTIKDVCDKIIHAESIAKMLDSELEAEIVELKGTEFRGRLKQEWSLGLSVALFCEGVLNWIDEHEEN